MTISFERYAQVWTCLFRAEDTELTLLAFNDIAEHDIVWGDRSINEIDVVEFGDRFDSPLVQGILSHGLVCLRRLIDADSYNVRHQILCSPGSDYNWNFLHEALMNELWRSDDGKFLADYRRKDEAALARDHAAFAPDPDHGPADAWRWAHQDETRRGFLYSFNQVLLRARGYCMWDRERLNGWSVFQQPWRPPDYPHRGEQASQRRSEMASSQLWRSTLLANGRHGYY
jgi:hypothetical protein